MPPRCGKEALRGEDDVGDNERMRSRCERGCAIPPPPLRTRRVRIRITQPALRLRGEWRVLAPHTAAAAGRGRFVAFGGKGTTPAARRAGFGGR
eukprot:gene18367-16726_t